MNRSAELALDYKRRAEECRELAASYVIPEDKQAWLCFAENWQALASESDKPALSRSLKIFGNNGEAA